MIRLEVEQMGRFPPMGITSAASSNPASKG